MAKEELREEIKIEMENLERLNSEMKQLLTKTSDEPGFIRVTQEIARDREPSQDTSLCR